MYSAAVIILNWNGEEHLSHFLPSVVEHTPEHIDIIVADNGSTDGSIKLLEEEFPSVKILKLDKNYGFAGGYNRALEAIDYEYYILLNSDIEATPNWCEPLLEEIHSNPDIGAVAPKLLSYCEREKFEYAGAAGGFIDFLGYPFCRGRILQHTEQDCAQYDAARDVFWVSGAAFVTRADIFHSLGGFDSDFFAHMEEIDICWRMQLAGYRVRILPQSKVYHLGGGTLNVDSPHKVFLNHRNNLAMLYKCAPTRQRLLVAVVRPVLDIAAAFSYLLQGQARNFVAVIRAYRDFIMWHGSLSKKRKAIRGSRVAESKYIYSGSIVARYIFGKREFKDII